MLHLIMLSSLRQGINTSLTFSHIGLFLIRYTTISTYPLPKYRGFLKVIAEYWKQLSNLNMVHIILGFPDGSDGKESTCDVGDLGSIPGLGRFSWRREWQPTPVFLPGEFHWQRSLVDYSPWGHKESDTTEWLNTHTHTHTHITPNFHVGTLIIFDNS